MVLSWIRKGLRTGIVTTRYPVTHDQLPRGSRGKPNFNPGRCLADQGCSACVQVCLPGALHLANGASEADEPDAKIESLTLDLARCVMCGLCVNACPVDALYMTEEYELAATDHEALRTTAFFTTGTDQPDIHRKEENNGTSA